VCVIDAVSSARGRISIPEKMKFVLAMEDYSVHGVRDALNATLAEYEPLKLVLAAFLTCFLSSIVTSAISSAFLALNDNGTSLSNWSETCIFSCLSPNTFVIIVGFSKYNSTEDQR